MEISTLKAAIAAQFRHQNGVVAVLLYGSHAKGVTKPDSDVDIAVLYRNEDVPKFMTLWKYKEILESLLHTDVDLVCLNEAGVIIASQIYKYHQPILINDQKALDQYFMYLISDYAELKELRKPMETRILERRYYSGS